ncbi:hypothetical protein FHR85_000517 [Alkalibacillus almallahensis]|nr:hypothetical protein [Alkalibacillus almallahensis]
MYDSENLQYHNIKNNALIIEKKDGEEIRRHQYNPIYKDTVKTKDENGKIISITFTIRKSVYSEHYHLITEKISLLFENEGDLKRYLSNELSFDWGN